MVTPFSAATRRKPLIMNSLLIMIITTHAGILVCAALICFLADPQTNMPAWVVIIIISREFIISGFRLVAAEKGVTIAASYWGKVKTFVQMAMSIFLVFHFQAEVFRIIESILIYASVILTIISLVDYIYKNRGVMKDVR